MVRTIKIVATLDLDENHPSGSTITPREIARDLVRNDVMELFEFEEGFRDLTVEVVDEPSECDKSLQQCIRDYFKD